jgi:hypothetical protein
MSCGWQTIEVLERGLRISERDQGMVTGGSDLELMLSCYAICVRVF